MGYSRNTREELPRLGTVIKKEGYLLLPVIILVLRLVIGRSPFDAALWAIISAVFLGFFREDTRMVGLPPLIARALGVPGWGTDVDRARVRAEFATAALLRENRPAAEVEAEYRRIVDAAIAAPHRGLLEENWMIGAGVGLFAVLLAAGFSLDFALFWGLAVTFVLSSPRVIETFERGAMNSLIIGVTAGIVGAMLAGISVPGLGLKFPSIVIAYSRIFVDLFGWTGSELFMAILLVGAAAYVMGHGDDGLCGLCPPLRPRCPRPDQAWGPTPERPHAHVLVYHHRAADSAFRPRRLRRSGTRGMRSR